MFTHPVLVAVAVALLAGTVEAQDIQKFVINSDAARRAKTRDEISFDTARRISDHCFQEAARRNMGVSIFVLSPSGHIVYAARADGQTPVNIETALMKARTALFMRDSTHTWMNRTMQDPQFEARLRPLGMFWNSGGLPIVVNDVLIGVIGVGGMAPAPDWNDEICAHRALTAVIGPQPALAPVLEPAPQR